MRVDSVHPILDMSVRKCVVGLTIIAALLSPQAHAVNPASRISQYAHTSWRLQDGLFSGLPYHMAQTRDGYIWMGTRTGMLRFDGVRSVPFTSLGGKPLPSGRVGALLGATDGSLWIGSGNGLAQWKGGELISYPTIPGGIVQILEDSNGIIWVARTGKNENAGPVCRVLNGISKCFGAAEGIPADICCAEALALDATGGVWIGSNDTLVQLTGSSVTTHKLDVSHQLASLAAMRGIATSPDGSVWVGITARGRGLGLQRWLRGTWKAFVTPQLDGSALEVTHLLMDHNGALWVGTADKGLYRIRNGQVDHFGEGDGMTSDFVDWIFEDLEGDIWVRTPKGLDSFRDLRVVTWSAHEGLTADNVGSVIATRDGTVWAGNANGLDSIRAGSVASIRSGNGFPGDRTAALFEDRGGRLWVGAGDDLTVYEGQRFKIIRGKDGKPIGPVTGIAQDAAGDIYAQAYGHDTRLTRIHADHVTEELRTPQTVIAGQIAADSSGNIWTGLKTGDLVVYRDTKTEIVSYEHDSISSVRAVVAGNDGSVFGATNYGVIGWRRAIKRTLSAKNALPCDSAFGLVLDRADNLWIYMLCGIVEVEKAELERWWNDPSVQVRSKMFDILDGFQPGAPHFNAAASMSPDGRLWFATGNVLQVIDPALIGARSIIPPVHIEEVIADRKRFSASDGVRLPALTRVVELDYTALSFSAPLKIRFRYKMEGREAEWQDAGSRRQALFNDLGPGTYRFHVIASNIDGLWNNEGATLVFVIAPAFYQTWWFRLTCVLVAVGSIRMFYLFRLQQATAKIQERLNGRLEERERIARELHDTLLQGFQGIMLRFQAVMRLLPPEAPAQRMMEKVLDRADEVLLEGRQQVRELRTDTVAGDELQNLLTTCGKELSEEWEAAFSITIMGTPRPLAQSICGDAYRVGREALINAFQHAAATKVEVEITFAKPGVRLIVRDDGKGLDQRIVDKGRDGHWGLVGMRERARKIDARLKIWSHPGAGTEIELNIPAKVAYSSERNRSLWWLRARETEEE